MYQVMRRAAFAVVAVSCNLQAGIAFAQELNWKIVKTRSVGRGVSCDPNSIQLIQAGGDVSLLFNEMRVDLPAGDKTKVKNEWGFCNVGMNLTIPKDYYITSASTQIIGGIEKDKGTHGYIDVTTHLLRRLPTILDPVNGGGPFGKILHAQRHFPINKEISEPLFVLEDSRKFNARDAKNMCDWTKTSSASIGMMINVRVAGHRPKVDRSMILSADNVDSHFDLGVRIGKCSKK